MILKFVTEKCPKCGHDPDAILCWVPGWSLLQSDGGGGFDYDGDTEMLWDDSVLDEHDKTYQLRCGDCRETWRSESPPHFTAERRVP